MVSGELSALFGDDTSHFVGTPVSVVASDVPELKRCVTEEIVERSNTPRNVAKDKGVVAMDKDHEASASIVTVFI